MIIHKPRQLRIDLDPDQGFPAMLTLECAQLVVEEGHILTELPPHTETFDPSSCRAKDILGEITAQAIAALKTYQDEVQRLAAQLYELKANLPVSE